MTLAADAVGRGFRKDNRLQALDILVRAQITRVAANRGPLAVEGSQCTFRGARRASRRRSAA